MPTYTSAYASAVAPVRLAFGRREGATGPAGRGYGRYVADRYGAGIEHVAPAASE